MPSPIHIPKSPIQKDVDMVRHFILVIDKYLKTHENCFISGAFVASDPDERLLTLLTNASNTEFIGTSHQL